MSEPLMTWQELEKVLEKSKPHNHLLLGNGFNSSLKARTDYKSVFAAMKKVDSIYENIEGEVKGKDEGYDVEEYLAELAKRVISRSREDPSGEFLVRIAEKKVKFDFMRTLYGKARGALSRIYGKRGKRVREFLDNFARCFTTNYDPYLYLLLLGLKDLSEGKASMVTMLNEDESGNQPYEAELFEDVKKAHKEWLLKPKGFGDVEPVHPKTLTRKFFQEICVYWISKECPGKYSKPEIRRAADLVQKYRGNWDALIEERKGKPTFPLPKGKHEVGKPFELIDGFRGLPPEYRGHKGQEIKNIHDPSTYKYIHYLHGALHIVSVGGGRFEKITQTNTERFRERIETVINGDSEKVVCVFTGTTHKKLQQINEHRCLKDSLDDLGEINGNLVILGSSLSSKDKHIFRRIKRSGVKTVYVGVSRKDADFCTKIKAAKAEFQEKVKFFDHYDLPHAKVED